MYAHADIHQDCASVRCSHLHFHEYVRLCRVHGRFHVAGNVYASILHRQHTEIRDTRYMLSRSRDIFFGIKTSARNGRSSYYWKRMSSANKIVVDPFCFRQFDKDGGKVFIDCDRQTFETKINEIYEANGGDASLKEGYAPFCKHLFVENFVGTVSPCVAITKENEQFLKSSYEARTKQELPVLVRYFNKEDVKEHIKPAQFLDIILYSGEQIVKENEAMNTTRESDAPWGIVSIKPQDTNMELPMTPMTMMRNALGKEEGGSGVPLERNKYEESVAYWSQHATVVG